MARQGRQGRSAHACWACSGVRTFWGKRTVIQVSFHHCGAAQQRASDHMLPYDRSHCPAPHWGRDTCWVPTTPRTQTCLVKVAAVVHAVLLAQRAAKGPDAGEHKGHLEQG